MNLNIFNSFFALVILSVFAISCGEQTPDTFSVNGQIENASNLQIFLDELTGPGGSTNILSSSEIDGSGNFAIKLEQGLKAGVYRLRIGARKIPLVLNGTEDKINITATLDDLPKFNFNVDGSGSAHSFQNLLSGLAQRKLQTKDVVNYMDTVSNPYGATYAAELAIGANGKYLDALTKAQAKLEKEYTGTAYGTNFGKFVTQTKMNFASQQANELVKVGAPAPQISGKSPDGKTYKLSDLKGKIVLLDFWASWCGPCRRENPNVVRTYDKYKDQGFTVFSVSLDGLDERTKRRFSSDAQIDQQMEAQKNRWVSAIAKDNLKWEYHVSDLKKWDSMAAKTYGVRGIPKTFLIDREGKIAAINPRGGKLEPALQGLL